jgi:O-succinylbenzoic acid--CoA ligase
MADIRCPLREAADLYGDQPAIFDDGNTLTYLQYEQWVSGTTDLLRGAGCKEGDRVTILLPGNRTNLILLMALLRIGAVACPLDPRIPAKTLKALLDKISCEKLILSTPDALAAAFPGVNLLNSEALIAYDQRKRPGSRDKRISLQRPATILFTSGSSGVPKAVLHSYGSHYFSAKGSNLNIPMRLGDRWLLNVPLYHVSGLGIIFRCLLGRAAVVVPRKGEEVGQSLVRYGITHVSLVATQLYRLLRQSSENISAGDLRAVLLGGSAFPPGLLKEARARKLPIHTSYGLTEMTSQVTTTGENASPEKCFTSGQVLKYRQVKIAKDGEILVKGETLFAGYVERGRVVVPLGRDGWFATGDLGELDSGGYLTVRGRKDRMFISGGENIHPEEMELALCNLADITQAVVVPVPDEEFGYRPVAFVRSRQEPIHPETLAEALQTKLPRYKIPIAFYPWPESIETDNKLKIDLDFFQKIALKSSRVT